MEEATTLSAEEITVMPVVGADSAQFTCCNTDPNDQCYSYYDADPTNGRW